MNLSSPFRARALAEPLVLACGAAVLSGLLLWLGPPGTDFAAHAYQRSVFLHHGFALWDNFWYAGRYSFITYSILYYPVAAVVGILPLAVVTVAVATVAFWAVLTREWGAAALWSIRSFAVVWACFVLTGAFPFALGLALALLALWALQSGAVRGFALLSVLTFAASPLALALLVLLVTGAIAAQRRGRRMLLRCAVAAGCAGVLAVLLQQAFPSAGRFPYPPASFVAAILFCGAVAALAWSAPRGRLLAAVCLVLGLGCIVSFVLPSAVGENISRFRYIAVPIAVLACALRAWRPLWLVTLVLAATAVWNITPLAVGVIQHADDPTAQKQYWAPATSFLRAHLGRSYRVEVVGTADHWEAAYLPRAGIPLTRGWFRQDDFPQNELFYERLTRTGYLAWLRRLGVQYVLVTDARPDYSSRQERALLLSGRSGLPTVWSTAHLHMYAVPDATSIITGPGTPRIRALGRASVTVWLSAPGTYRLAVRYSPYWRASSGCVYQTRDGMIAIAAREPGSVRLWFSVSLSSAFDAVTRATPRRCAR